MGFITSRFTKEETMNLQETPPPLAHPAKRFQAQFIDGLIAYALGMVAFYWLDALTSREVSFSLAIMVGSAYFLFSDALPNGQSLGKKRLKMQVVHKETMAPCSMLQSLLRNITFPLGIFDWGTIFFGSHRRLGDYIANTVVVKVTDKAINSTSARVIR